MFVAGLISLGTKKPSLEQQGHTGWCCYPLDNTPGAGQFTTWQFKGLWQNFKRITHLNTFRTVTLLWLGKAYVRILEEGHSSNDVWWACLVWGLVDNLCQLYAFWHDPLHWHWSAYTPAVLFVCMMLCKSICDVPYTLHLYVFPCKWCQCTPYGALLLWILASVLKQKINK